jgi:hypothetical protein
MQKLCPGLEPARNVAIDFPETDVNHYAKQPVEWSLSDAKKFQT